MTTRRWWPTAAEIAANIRSSLDAGNELDALRMLADGVNYLTDAHAAGDLDHTLAEPPGIGDLRWDTLLAASIRYRLHSLNVPAPRWTYKPPLDTFWWPVKISASQQRNDMAHTPAELLRVNIFMDDREFTSA